jgi:(p)ppGpp synthase/HD superfamily hydrolase
VDLDEVRRFAAAAHAGEVRKGSGQPYIAHPEAVAQIQRELGVDDPVILAAALLHDVVENTSVTVADIAARFGDDVAGLVGELTRPVGTHENRDAFRLYLDSLGPRALLIKLADRIENMRGLQFVHDDATFVRDYLDETRELFLPLAERTDAQLAALLREAYESAAGGLRS